MKTMEDDLLLAKQKSLQTMWVPSPWNFWKNLETNMKMKVVDVVQDISLAIIAFPEESLGNGERFYNMLKKLYEYVNLYLYDLEHVGIKNYT